LKPFWNGLQTSIWNASLTIDKITGYDVVKHRKNRVLEQDQNVTRCKNEFTIAKQEYERLIELGRQTQRDLDHLRERKRIQSFDDINQITKLYETLLSLETQEKNAKERYTNATRAFEKSQVDYLNDMRERYVEDQLYSDKIRQTSTWWTWGLITTHLMIFLVVQLIIEPRKRESLKNEMLQVVEQSTKKDNEFISILIESAMKKNQDIIMKSVENSLEINHPVHDNAPFWKELCFVSTIGMFLSLIIR
jgi:sensitive to high expression protein 9